MREVLRTFADWYAKGYLRKDFMSQDMNAVGQDTISGKQGIHIFWQWWYVYAPDLVKNHGNDSYFEAYEMPSMDGGLVIHPRDFDNGNYLVINKNCKNIDAAVKCISFYQYIAKDVVAQKLMSKEEIDKYILNGQGLHNMRMFKTEDPIDEEKQFRQIQEAKRTGDTSVFTSTMTVSKYNWALDWINNKNADNIGGWLQMYHDKSAYAVNIKVYEQDRYIPSRMAGPVPEEVASYGSTLDDLLREGFTKIIVGQEPLSYFDTLVRQWKSAGGDAATAVMNRVYGGK
jgi:putative aldouronate transport system substrate-binding protein